MEKIPTLPVYDTTPEGEADRRVDQGCGAYYDYGYGVDGDQPERSGGLSRSGKRPNRRDLWRRSRYRPYGEPSESDLMYPEPKKEPLSDEQREINRRGLALARKALERARKNRENGNSSAESSSRQTPEDMIKSAEASWGERQGELF